MAESDERARTLGVPVPPVMRIICLTEFDNPQVAGVPHDERVVVPCSCGCSDCFGWRLEARNRAP
jgi:hypothetical protein